MRSIQRLGLGALVLLCCVGCDRVTKHIAVAELRDVPTQKFLGDLFRLTYAENPGAFLGLGGRLPGSAQFWILTVGVGALLFGMLGFLAFSRKLAPAAVAGLAMIAGGGLSNWFDRVVNDGRVVDFMNMGIGSLRTGIFNVADVAIMAGALLLVLPQTRKHELAPVTVPTDSGSGPTRSGEHDARST